MRHIVSNYVKSCDICHRLRRVTKLYRVPISRIVGSNVPYDTIHVDVLGEAPVTSSRGHKYILVVIYTCTRYADCVLLKALTAKETCQALLTIFHKYGICRTFINDNGTNFKTKVSR